MTVVEHTPKNTLLPAGCMLDDGTGIAVVNRVARSPNRHCHVPSPSVAHFIRLRTESTSVPRRYFCKSSAEDSLYNFAAVSTADNPLLPNDQAGHLAVGSEGTRLPPRAFCATLL